jgi:hypothetical protein
MRYSSAPLQWPDGWPRTDIKDRRDGSARFSTQAGPVSFVAAGQKLLDELRLLPAKNVVITYDHGDPSIAVYFTRSDNQYAIARDYYHTQADNLRSIGLAIAAMRQLERHGGSAMADRAFSGFVALPAPQNCWDLLGIKKEGATEEEVKRAYRQRAKEAHPDNGGSNAAMAALNKARDEAMRVCHDC